MKCGVKLKNLFVLVPIEDYVVTMNAFIKSTQESLQSLTLKKEGKDCINKKFTQFLEFNMPHLTSLNIINLNELCLKDYV